RTLYSWTEISIGVLSGGMDRGSLHGAGGETGDEVLLHHQEAHDHRDRHRDRGGQDLVPVDVGRGGVLAQAHGQGEGPPRGAPGRMIRSRMVRLPAPSTFPAWSSSLGMPSK